MRCSLLCVLVASLLGITSLTGCHKQPDAADTAAISRARQDELKASYEGLSQMLSDQASLKKLKWWKTLTLDAPNDAIAQLLTKLSDAGERHADKLSALRTLKPNLEGESRKRSAVGDAFSEIAKEKGSSELSRREGKFDVHFVLLQSQATAAIAYMASAVARFERNTERRAWLNELSKEYQAYREELIDYLERDRCK